MGCGSPPVVSDLPNETCSSPALFPRSPCDAIWYDEDGSELEESELTDQLDGVLSRDQHWREKNSPIAFFPLGHVRAVMVATFEKPANTPKRAKIQADLARSFSNASNAFDATHNRLTELPNRETFEKLVAEVLTRPPAETAGQAEQVEAGSPNPIIALHTAPG